MKKRIKATRGEKTKGKVLSTMLALSILYASQSEVQATSSLKSNVKVKKVKKVATGTRTVPNKKKKYRMKRVRVKTGISKNKGSGHKNNNLIY